VGEVGGEGEEEDEPGGLERDRRPEEPACRMGGEVGRLEARRLSEVRTVAASIW
jgi:hypothetical protein